MKKITPGFTSLKQGHEQRTKLSKLAKNWKSIYNNFPNIRKETSKLSRQYMRKYEKDRLLIIDKHLKNYNTRLFQKILKT